MKYLNFLMLAAVLAILLHPYRQRRAAEKEQARQEAAERQRKHLEPLRKANIAILQKQGLRPTGYTVPISGSSVPS